MALSNTDQLLQRQLHRAEGQYIVYVLWLSAAAYVGCSRAVVARIRDHSYRLRAGCHNNLRLQLAYDAEPAKYRFTFAPSGRKAFTWTVVGGCSTPHGGYDLERLTIIEYTGQRICMNLLDPPGGDLWVREATNRFLNNRALASGCDDAQILDVMQSYLDEVGVPRSAILRELRRRARSDEARRRSV